MAALKLRLGDEVEQSLKQVRSQEILLKNLKGKRDAYISGRCYLPAFIRRRIPFHIPTLTRSCTEELEDLEDKLEVETGTLMSHAVKKRRLIRAMAANEANFLANDVTGNASGGVKLIACAVDRHINCYDVQTGVMLAVLFGEREDARRPGGERPKGHAAKITALFLLRYRVYSGDHTGLIFVWDVMDGRNRKEKRKSKKKDRDKPDTGVSSFVPPVWAKDSGDCIVDVLDEHDAAVTALAADDEKLITGSADCTIRIWDALDDSFECLFTLKGHTRSVTTLQIVDFTFVSGDVNGHVRLWELVKPPELGGPPEKEADSSRVRFQQAYRGSSGGGGGYGFGGFGGGRDSDSDSDGPQRRYARVRLVLKIKHERSMDAPVDEAPAKIPTILDALAEEKEQSGGLTSTVASLLAPPKQQAPQVAERRSRSADAAQPGQRTVDKLLENCERNANWRKEVKMNQ